MDVKEVVFMSKGEGESSFARNSVFTQKLTSITKPILQNAVSSLFSADFFPCDLLNIADLGCAAGPNAFSIISTVIESVENKSRELNFRMPELQFYLNDLTGNDFNTLFKGLSAGISQSGNKGAMSSWFVMGAPGSFYGRLFPRNCLHLVHSSYSAHWLSQVPAGLTSKEGLPLNKGKIYISKTSPPEVRKAYLAQFQEDFNLFLSCRSEEMVPNGRAVLILHGRKFADPSSKEGCYTWEIIAEAISHLVSQGLVDEEKLDSFNVPYYMPSLEEVQALVEREGSFAIEKLEILEIAVGDDKEKDIWAKGEKLAKNIRCFTESMIAHHFGEEILDQLFDKLTHIVVDDLAKESRKTVSIIIVLRYMV
ncbi:hypothetical protein L1049_012115 [Liquidambar formosana]|uniref:Theobromine synthase n=1 Tax=Liquidambar formosana TaxID=63359 RepID=A0AAP0RXM2_LIQFO